MTQRTRRIEKWCTERNRSVYLEIEETLASGGLGSSGGEWVPGKRGCSDMAHCEADCKWAVGTANSSNDPMTIR